MTKDEALKLALEAAYLSGFNASGEGYNGEYPFGDRSEHPEQDKNWCAERDDFIKQALAAQPAPPECQTEAEKTAYAFGWWKALESQREQRPIKTFHGGKPWPVQEPAQSIWTPSHWTEYERDIRNAALDEIAGKIALMPFGDTAASFAVWIKEQKT
jgi:hypothetical protein